MLLSDVININIINKSSSNFMGFKVDYPQLNMIYSDARHRTNVVEVILNMIVSMETFLMWLLPKRDVQSRNTESFMLFMKKIHISVRI